MAGTLGFGAVLSWKGFQFPDGGQSDKLLIVLGAKNGKNIIAVICTSQPPRPPSSWTEGCHPAPNIYFMVKGGRNGWPKDTWVQLWRVVEISAARAVSEAFAGNLNVVVVLPKDTAAAIRNCLKQSPDLSAAQADLLE